MISFRFQILEWLFAIALVIFAFLKTPTLEKKIQNTSFSNLIYWMIGGYSGIAFLVKISQYFCLTLNAQDFWLFVDLFEFTRNGQYFLTRFGPQAWGNLQQGALHPFLPWVALTPLTYLFGSVGIALIFNPACIGLAAIYLNKLSEYLGFHSWPRLLLILAFLFSKHTSLIIMYETHPEALYPLLSLGLILALLRERWLESMLWAALLGIFKEDSFMVIWGSAVAAIFLKPSLLKNAQLILPILSALSSYFLQIKLIHYFLNHPHGGIIPEMGVLIDGHKWDSLPAIIETIKALLSSHGGIFGSLYAFSQFLISGSWLAILFPAPWIIFSPGFWLSELPLAFSFSLRGSHAILWNYYSAPFIAFFWVFLLKSLKNKTSSSWAFCVLLFSLLNGSEGLVLKIPGKEILNLRSEAQSYEHLIINSKQQGVVNAQLLPFVPLSRVISDRLPLSLEDEAKVNFYFLNKTQGYYNISVEKLNEKIAALRLPQSGFTLIQETEHFIYFSRHPKGS